jgi:hypothetical protein
MDANKRKCPRGGLAKTTGKPLEDRGETTFALAAAESLATFAEALCIFFCPEAGGAAGNINAIEPGIVAKEVVISAVAATCGG